MRVALSSIVPHGRRRVLSWTACVLASSLLLLLPWLYKLDGKAHADWQQFLGRFHPVVVHLPIGLILLVPLLELAGLFRAPLREAASFVLALSVFACLGAVMLGYLLAYGSGAIGSGVTRHMWAGIWLTIGVMVCALVRPSWISGRAPGLYPVLLGGVLLLMAWGTHQGGSLTHGSNYLTEYLPAPLKRLTSGRTVQARSVADPSSFYGKHIYPILDTNCVACHGDAKVKGGLRVDTYDLLMRGGKEGAVILPGRPDKSILMERITLPAGHKKFMPAEGKPPLTPEQISWIKAWILQGASPTVTSLTGVSIREEPLAAALPPVGDYSGMSGQIVELEKSEGVKIVPVSRQPSDGLILDAMDAAPQFNDAQLAQLDRLAPYIVEVELGKTSVTDSSFATLSKFTHLRSLHLEDTLVTGNGIAKLASLSELAYLNLSGTKVTELTVAPLRSMTNLHHLYLFNTPAQPVAKSAAVASVSSFRSTP